jgi:hypothetical protein
MVRRAQNARRTIPISSPGRQTCVREARQSLVRQSLISRTKLDYNEDVQHTGWAVRFTNGQRTAPRGEHSV